MSTDRGGQERDRGGTGSGDRISNYGLDFSLWVDKERGMLLDRMNETQGPSERKAFGVGDSSESNSERDCWIESE